MLFLVFLFHFMYVCIIYDTPPRRRIEAPLPVAPTHNKCDYRMREVVGGTTVAHRSSSIEGGFKGMLGIQLPPSKSEATARCTATERMPLRRRV